MVLFQLFTDSKHTAQWPKHFYLVISHNSHSLGWFCLFCLGSPVPLQSDTRWNGLSIPDGIKYLGLRQRQQQLGSAEMAESFVFFVQDSWPLLHRASRGGLSTWPPACSWTSYGLAHGSPKSKSRGGWVRLRLTFEIGIVSLSPHFTGSP